MSNINFESSDASLISSAKQGNNQAFDLLVTRYQYKLVKVLGSYISKNDVADVCQDVFIKAFRSLSAFRGDSSFYTWLYRVAINTAKNHVINTRKQHVVFSFELNNIDPIIAKYQLNEYSTPEKILISGEVKEIIYKTIEALPEDLRSVIVLREIEELSYEKISSILKCPVGTIRSRIFRARSCIEEKIKNYRVH